MIMILSISKVRMSHYGQILKQRPMTSSR